MTPGPDIVIACPKCGAPARLATIESGNTFGALRWTDGYMDAPMLPASPAVTSCRACKALHWVADAPALGKIETERHGISSRNGSPVDEATAERWRSAPEVRHPTRAQLFRAIEFDLADTEERERLLRTLAWHASNHPRRKGKTPAAGPEPRELDNMEKLLELETRALHEAALSAAELARELGRWDEVHGYLRVPFPAPLEAFSLRIAELALARDSRVASVP